MAPVKNGRLLFKSPHSGFIPVPGETAVYDETEILDLETVPLNGGYLVKTLYVSVDTYLQRFFKTYFKAGEIIKNFGIARVLRSEYPGVQAGDHVYGRPIEFAEYSILSELDTGDPWTSLRLIENTHKLSLSTFVGHAGMVGKTAYNGWREYVHAKKGETIFISTGAGPIGSLVIQFAKAEGLKVIASAGSDDKVQFMKDCGADIAFNYKTASTREVLSREGPLNIYWDHVGGETLDAALDHAAPFARFIQCGYISDQPVHNLPNIIGKTISLHGFTVLAFQKQYDEDFYKEIPESLANGKLKYQEEITEGIENMIEVLAGSMTGKNRGKPIIKVARDE
ncbi:alcohol dehydrogenase [Flagelloscypha sp. PMI_526]|nr:alcohol dehydrogenase [Flagelloscypha sp. PMI_526]